MSALEGWLLAIAMLVPQPANERNAETFEERTERIATITGAISKATDLMVMTGRWPGSKRRQLAAALMATAIRESGGLSFKVHSGAKRGTVGEICFMQINSTNRGAFAPWRFSELAGTDEKASLRCALAGARTLSWGRTVCRGKVASRDLLGGVLSRYLRGNRCNTSREGLVRLRLATSFLQTSELTTAFRCTEWPYTRPKFSWVEGPLDRPRKGERLCNHSTFALRSPLSSWEILRVFARSYPRSCSSQRLARNTVEIPRLIARRGSIWKTSAPKLARAFRSSERVTL